jgi:hypothetical protein
MSLQDSYRQGWQEGLIFLGSSLGASLLANVPMFPTHQLLGLRIIPNAPPLIILPILLPDFHLGISMLNHIKHTSLPLWLIALPNTFMRHSAFPSGLI